MENSSFKKIIEVKDRWVEIRVTADFAAAVHVMPGAMFPRVKLERKTSPKKFVAANGEQIRDLGEKNIPFKKNEEMQRCMLSNLSFKCKKWSEPETLLCWMKRLRTFETFETGTMIKLDVNNGVYTMDMWICVDQEVQFSAGKDSVVKLVLC